ncbi:MAG: hypothetical protein Q8K75_00130 [Chlamydiales bacterium]|nr:hypothetical protein [Chlamydiales bacterium]
MAEIEEELGEGDIHLRDKFQFELKSEYAPVPGRANNRYTLEFFFFIPTALHINKHTYTKKHFYYDQTSLLRLKTPIVPLKELIASNTARSGLYRIRQLYQNSERPNEKEVLRELKLYANGVRSALRDRSQQLIDSLKRLSPLVSLQSICRGIDQLCQETIEMRQGYLHFLDEYSLRWRDSRMQDYGQYIDEFLSITVQNHLAHLLREVELLHDPETAPSINKLQECIVWESQHRDAAKERSPFANDPEKNMEYFVYRSGLLKKFVWEVLFLNIIRKEPSKPFLEFAAVVAAGLAMLVYLVFLTMQGSGIIVNSTSFIVIAVLLYVVKDRMKDAIKNMSATFATKWFPDYFTDISTSDGETKLGYLKEYFSFVEPKQIPKEILTIRNTGFHTELERAERMEQVFYFKKEVTLFSAPEDAHTGEHRELNDILRYNISSFLVKASDAYKEHFEIDPKTGQLISIQVPKVYHINIIIRRTYQDSTDQTKSDIGKYRVVLDKEGIKRIEKVL